MKMMRYILTCVFCLAASVAGAQDPGAIEGTVIPKNGQAGKFALIEVFSDGVKRGKTVTDDEGRFVVKPLPPGTYIVIAKYGQYKPMWVTDVMVTSNQTSYVDYGVKASMTYDVLMKKTLPLMLPDGKPQSKWTWDDIRNIGDRDLSKLVSQQTTQITARQQTWGTPEGVVTHKSNITLGTDKDIVVLPIDTPKKKKGFFSFLKRKKNGKQEAYTVKHT